MKNKINADAKKKALRHENLIDINEVLLYKEAVGYKEIMYKPMSEAEEQELWKTSVLQGNFVLILYICCGLLGAMLLLVSLGIYKLVISL